jgi:O-antigen ligase
VVSVLPIALIGIYHIASHKDIEITTSYTPRALSIAYGLYLLLGLLAVTTFLRLGWRPRVLMVAAALIGVGGLMLVQSRSIFLVVLALLLAYILSSAVAERHSTRRPALLVGLVLLASGLVLVVSPIAGGHSFALSRVASFFSLSTDPNANFRLHEWSVATSLAANHPVLGVGYGHLNLLPDGIAVHNSIVMIFFEAGVAGLAAFVAINVFFYRMIMGSSGLKSRALTYRRLAVLALCWQIAVFGIAVFNVALEGPFIGIFFWIAIGFGAAVAQLGDTQSDKHRLGTYVRTGPGRPPFNGA